MGPITRKRFKLYLNPRIYKAFRLLCQQKGEKRVNRIIECFMAACLNNSTIIYLVKNLAREIDPDIFSEPPRSNRKLGKLRKIEQELEELLEKAE